MSLFVYTDARLACRSEWHSIKKPDPDKTHYPALKEACDQLLKKKGVTADQLYLWIE